MIEHKTDARQIEYLYFQLCSLNLGNSKSHDIVCISHTHDTTMYET